MLYERITGLCNTTTDLLLQKNHTPVQSVLGIRSHCSNLTKTSLQQKTQLIRFVV